MKIIGIGCTQASVFDHHFREASNHAPISDSNLQFHSKIESGCRNTTTKNVEWRKKNSFHVANQLWSLCRCFAPKLNNNDNNATWHRCWAPTATEIDSRRKKISNVSFIIRPMNTQSSGEPDAWGSAFGCSVKEALSLSVVTKVHWYSLYNTNIFVQLPHSVYHQCTRPRCYAFNLPSGFKIECMHHHHHHYHRRQQCQIPTASSDGSISRADLLPILCSVVTKQFANKQRQQQYVVCLCHLYIPFYSMILHCTTHIKIVLSTVFVWLCVIVMMMLMLMMMWHNIYYVYIYLSRIVALKAEMSSVNKWYIQRHRLSKSERQATARQRHTGMTMMLYFVIEIDVQCRQCMHSQWNRALHANIKTQTKPNNWKIVKSSSCPCFDSLLLPLCASAIFIMLMPVVLFSYSFGSFMLVFFAHHSWPFIVGMRQCHRRHRHRHRRRDSDKRWTVHISLTSRVSLGG